MSDLGNIPQDVRVIGGIDTLYYFADISGENYNKIYDELISNEKFFPGFEFLGYSGKSTGFVGSWFDYKEKGKYTYNGKKLDIRLFRVGFKSPYKQMNVKNVYIQLYAEGIYYLGLENLIQFVEEKFAEFGLFADEYYVSRADINAFVNYDFSKINYSMFKVPSRAKESIRNLEFDTKTKEYTGNARLETLYFGSKSSDINLKIYDKKKELFTNGIPASAKALVMLTYFLKNGINLPNDDVWNIEFSLKRRGLKSYGIDTIQDLLNKAGNVFKDLMTKYVFLGYDVKKIESYRKSKNLSRLSPHSIWEVIREGYNRYDIVPVQRIIKYYKSNVNEVLLQKIRVNLNDLSNNLEIPLKDVVDLVLRSLSFNNKRKVV
jgi:hypothetical protein